MSDPQVRFPPGHFYSPVPSLEEIGARDAELFAPSEKLGIELGLPDQLARLAELAELYADCPYVLDGTPDAFRRDGSRYVYPNGQFALGDAILLHCMLRHLEPQRLIEVGGGWTSCVTLDARQRFLRTPLACTFIEPYPDRLRAALFETDPEECRIIEAPVQRIPLELFETLEKDDVLFIDSSHVAKIGSDVNYLFFEVLPRLRPGVVVHVHDVHSEFEYRRDLIYNGCFWNEAYLLRAFLMYNSSFEILLFSSLLSRRAAATLRERMPLVLDSGSSIWIRRT